MNTSIITSLILIIVLPFIMKPGELKESKNGQIIFEFSKAFKLVLLIGTIILFAITLFFFLLSFFGEKDTEYVALVFLPLTIICLLSYMFIRNKKIVFEKDKFIVFNFLGKKREFDIHGITKLKVKEMDGIVLYFSNNKKIKIDEQMDNFPEIYNILKNIDVPRK